MARYGQALPGAWGAGDEEATSKPHYGGKKTDTVYQNEALKEDFKNKSVDKKQKEEVNYARGQAAKHHRHDERKTYGCTSRRH